MTALGLGRDDRHDDRKTGDNEATRISHETRHRVREGLLCLEKENPTQRQWTEHRVPACPPNFLDLT
jgi:hypothetical protein